MIRYGTEIVELRFNFGDGSKKENPKIKFQLKQDTVPIREVFFQRQMNAPKYIHNVLELVAILYLQQQEIFYLTHQKQPQRQRS